MVHHLGYRRKQGISREIRNFYSLEIYFHLEFQPQNFFFDNMYLKYLKVEYCHNNMWLIEDIIFYNLEKK